MKRILDRPHGFALLAAALLGLAVVPTAAVAQSELDTAEAEAFVGTWDVAMDTQMGPINLDLVIEDMDGKVGASMGSPEMGGSQPITNITREGENLLMSYEMDAQGQIVPVMVTLTPSGEDLDAELNFADGMFVAMGTATRTDG